MIVLRGDGREMFDVNESQDVGKMSLLRCREEGSGCSHDATVESTEARHRHEDGDAPREHAHYLLRESHRSRLGTVNKYT